MGSDTELEVQKYGGKKNTLTVDPIMLEDELWMNQGEKPSPNCRSETPKRKCEVQSAVLRSHVVCLSVCDVGGNLEN